MSAPTSSSRRATLGALGLYLALSGFYFALPLAGDLRDHAIAADQLDSSAYMWFLAWWPHAIGDGLGAIRTEHVFVPEGYNLAWTTALPGPSMVLAPLTLALGPLATWNAIMLVGPALAAWTAFLLCRELTGATLPALAGGYLFGFSPYILGNVQGSPNLVLVWLLPLLVLLVVRHARGTLGGRAFVVSMALALAFQFLTSTEVLAMTAVFGGLTLVTAWLVLREWRARLLETLKLLAVASAAAVIVVSPLLWYMLFEPYTVPEQALKSFPADLLSWVVPSSYIALATGHDPGDGPSYATGFGYLGVPLALLLVLFAVDGFRRPAARVVLVALAATAVASLGTRLQVGGEDTGIPMPWAVLSGLPGLEYAIPVRFAGFTFLAAAVAMAMWLSWRGGLPRWGLALVAIAFVLPNVGNAIWRTPSADPPLIADGGYRDLLAGEDRVLTVPAWGPNMRWQANADFDFELAAGYLGAFPESYLRYPIWQTLLSGQLIPDYEAELRRFVRDKGVTAVLVEEGAGEPWDELFGSLGVRPREAGGMLLYRLAPPPGETARVRYDRQPR
jgi:hypothetical protein